MKRSECDTSSGTSSESSMTQLSLNIQPQECFLYELSCESVPEVCKTPRTAERQQQWTNEAMSNMEDTGVM